MIKFKVDKTRLEALNTIQLNSTLLTEAVSEKMLSLVIKLQEKMRSKTKGRVAEAVRNPRVEVEGGLVIGKLDVGGEPTTVSYAGGKEYDITRIINEGAKSHRIDPLGESTGLTGPGQPRGGTRKHGKGETRRFGKNVLRFYSEKLGKVAFATALYGKSAHPGVEGSHFIETSVDEMKSQFESGIRETLQEWAEKRSR